MWWWYCSAEFGLYCQTQAELASFIYADVVVAGGSYSSQSKASFLQQLEAKATELGVGYVGPDGAAAMLNGDFSVLKVIDKSSYHKHCNLFTDLRCVYSPLLHSNRMSDETYCWLNWPAVSTYIYGAMMYFVCSNRQQWKQYPPRKQHQLSKQHDSYRCYTWEMHCSSSV
jgi:hypothetical protein